MDKRDQIGRALRRGVALGLVLVACWGLSLMADLSGVKERLAALGQEPGLSVSLLSSQLGELPRQTASAELTGWGRLLLSHSALLAAGEEAVAEVRDGADPMEDLGSKEELVDEEEQGEPDLKPPTEDEGILEMTAKGKEGGKYLHDQGVYVYDRTDLGLDASVLGEGTVDVPLGEGPQILILHTHGSEAYSQSDGRSYEESDPYRTTDCNHNMVRVGEEMATVFRAHGLQVVHDTNLYDYPAYNGAYDRSKAAVEQWLKQYPTIKVVLDVHRDALVGNEGEIYKLVSEEAGRRWPRSCWWWAPTALAPPTPAGGTIWPLESSCKKTWSQGTPAWPGPSSCATAGITSSSRPATSWWRWEAMEILSPRPWPVPACGRTTWPAPCWP